jgi:hypothetical protein
MTMIENPKDPTTAVFFTFEVFGALENYTSRGPKVGP